MNELNPADLELNKSTLQVSIENAKAVILGIHSHDINVAKVYSFILNCIELIYAELIKELSLSSEKDRFMNVERKLNNVLFEAHKRGIRIDSKKVRGYIEHLNFEIYKIKNRLQLEFGIFSLHDYDNIYLKVQNEFPIFKDIIVDTRDFWDAVKLQADNSELLSLLYLQKKLTKNKDILARIGSLDTEYIKPYFNYFGTVTGRILVNSPALQQTNRKYRDIIIPNADMELIYVDYTQFEAGILASEANEIKLIQMYNDKDIYIEISNKLGSDIVSRELAKKMFFCYCYGMSKENIRMYTGKNIDLFFGEFPDLETFEAHVGEQFLNSGYVETSSGNRRYKSLNNVNNQKEGWLISQRIQGLASLIIKEVILDIFTNQKDIEFLLPMHDAILYRVPKDKVDELTRCIEDAYMSILKKYCPSLNPKVLKKAFFEEEHIGL